MSQHRVRRASLACVIVAAAAGHAHAQPTPPGSNAAPPAPSPAGAPPAPPDATPAPTPSPAPEPSPVPPPAPPRLVPPADLPPPGNAREPRGLVTYADGLVIATRDDEFALRIDGRVQVRDELDHQPGGFANRLVIPTARLQLDGHMLADLDYALSAELGSGSAQLADAYVDRGVFGARLRLGRFKVPFSRQQLATLVDQQFTQRAITSAPLAADRDLGAMVYAPAAPSGGLEWALAVFNGYTANELQLCPGGTCGQTPLADHPVGVVRAGWASAHADGYEESDLDGGPPRLAVAANYMIDFARGTTALMRHTGGLDVVVKAYGYSLNAAGYAISQRDDRSTPRVRTYLGHGQLGYFLIPRHVELAGRYARVERGDVAAQEALGVVNVFRHGRQAKWQLEGGATRADNEPSWNWLVRLQTQLVF